MASEGGKEPLLIGQQEPGPETNSFGSFKSRNLRRCKSAPMVEPVPEDTKMDRFYDGPRSIFEQLKPKFGRVALYLFGYLGLSTFCFYLVRNQITGKGTQGIVDGLYFCVVTMTTVGYGDLLPNSTTTKLLACAFVFSGMALVGLSLSKAADCLVENQEILLVKALHLRQKAGSMEILKETETNRVRYRCIIFSVLLMILITAGTIFLITVEKMDFIDAFYCVCTTMTTLGYGDKTFSTMAGRIFAIFWILMSTICLAQVLFAFAELYTENRQRELVRWVLTRKTTVADLEAADLNDDGLVGGAEFVIYKLKEMGKINQEDIAVIMAEFEKLDADDSGSLSVADISQAQSQ
ncbi:two-pore potassium channel 1-like isoform X2 [Cynara cardunculus var. scolymus]|nr:two-pore potassium channel 1-like isoform X1 [Cynara cardunculus var. scolymus]XP_024967524.1 two-pore potassium channel 1-like isoform X1 [Cynara cardunculus var. scolymus]XP_024967525.1 two-pore potassium channel 1-like isoform X1 [Cynara cardunculus var. scolymus]XP_024967526.1 two-pore potassium channel 1-like isoform X2 [Cynara cardunculus var. scolymus]